MTNLQAIDLLKGLEQSLDDYCELNDEGKTAFGMAITALELFGNSEQLPSAQPDSKELSFTQKKLDTISRQAAIDALKTQADTDTVSRQAARMCLTGDVTDMSIAQYIKMVDKRLAQLPSAHPEIIRCKDCKWKQGAECVRFADVRPFADDFCSRAERRTDG